MTRGRYEARIGTPCPGEMEVDDGAKAEARDQEDGPRAQGRRERVVLKKETRMCKVKASQGTEVGGNKGNFETIGPR